MEEFIASGADLYKIDASGRNALMQSIIFGNRETTLVLLANSSNLEIRDNMGLNPLNLSHHHLIDHARFCH